MYKQPKVQQNNKNINQHKNINSRAFSKASSFQCICNVFAIIYHLHLISNHKSAILVNFLLHSWVTQRYSWYYCFVFVSYFLFSLIKFIHIWQNLKMIMFLTKDSSSMADGDSSWKQPVRATLDDIKKSHNREQMCKNMMD